MIGQVSLLTMLVQVSLLSFCHLMLGYLHKRWASPGMCLGPSFIAHPKCSGVSKSSTPIASFTNTCKGRRIVHSPGKLYGYSPWSLLRQVHCLPSSLCAGGLHACLACLLGELRYSLEAFQYLTWLVPTITFVPGKLIAHLGFSEQ